MYAMGMRNELCISWIAYTSEHFDAIYNAHAERIGHRPAFVVMRGEGHARVLTTDDDRSHAQAVIDACEAAVA